MRASFIVLAIVSLLFSERVSAQSWPVRPIRFIVPFAAGGATDLLARALAKDLQQALGQPVFIEDLPGANATVGTRKAATSAPDGYTFVLLSNAQTLNETLQPDRHYDLIKDFAPVTLIGTFAVVLVAHKSVPAKNLSELINFANSQPDFTYASSGTGGAYHLNMELLSSETGLKARHIPYSSSSNARTDLIAGRIPMMFDGLATMLPFIKAGTVQGIAVAGLKRSKAAPQLPTIAESGVPGFSGDAWIGLAAPAGTSQEIISRLQQEISKVLQNHDEQVLYEQNAAEPIGSSSEAFSVFLKQEIAKWVPVLKAAGLKPN